MQFCGEGIVEGRPSEEIFSLESDYRGLRYDFGISGGGGIRCVTCVSN